MAVENGRNGHSIPRSVRQKQILDVAAEHPDASLETIALEVPSATVDLVEQVLEEYGDPANGRADQPEAELPEPPTEERIDQPEAEPSEDTTEERTDQPDADRSDDSTEGRAGPPDAERPDVETGDDPPVPSSLTDEQRETLRAVYRNPEATQKEIGEILGVARATVSNRVNAIDGFDWDDRYAMASAFFDASPAGSPDAGSGTAADAGGRETTVERLSSRVEALERRLDGPETGTDPDVPLDDPQLVHKIMHACLESDAITEADELRIVKALIE